MTMAADDPRVGQGPAGDWRPVPDPTSLTTAQLRRELSGLREILTARLDGMDRATDLLSETVNRTPTVIQVEISHVRELMQEKLGSLGGQAEEKFISLHQQLIDRDARYAATGKTHDEQLGALSATFEEKFASIALQFSERDVRTEQAATASASALAAALQAAKEAVFEQAQAAAKAAEKTELSFTKQIDQIQLQIKTIGDGFGDRLAELKERIDRGEGSDSGSSGALRSAQANTNQRIVTIGVIVSIVVVFVNVFLYLTVHH